MPHYPRFLFGRIAQAVIVILLVYVVTFVIVSILPGDPVTNRLNSPEFNYSDEEKAKITAYYGLDKPIVQQLLTSLFNFFQGNLGYSLRTNQPVSQTVLEAIPSTLQLASLALLFAFILAFLIGLGAVYLPRRYGGNLLRAFPALFLSLPNFLIGLIIIQIFSFSFGWFTIIDDGSLYSAVFPAVALAIPVSSQIAQVFISSLDSQKTQNYITTAVSKGLTPFQIFISHLFKPSSLPTVTVTALAVGEVLAGSVITEAVFSRNGIGSVIERAVVDQDIPVLQAAVTLAALIFVVVNLITDLIYPILDPRLRGKALS